MYQSKRTGNGRVSIETGAEGPRHDPYSYTELSVERGEEKITLHEGLGEWLKVNGKIIEEVTPRQKFEQLVGVSVRSLEKALDRTVCECGSKRFHSERGYPGETLYICNACGNICGGSFNEGAVM